MIDRSQSGAEMIGCVIFGLAVLFAFALGYGLGVFLS